MVKLILEKEIDSPRPDMPYPYPPEPDDIPGQPNEPEYPETLFI